MACFNAMSVCTAVVASVGLTACCCCGLPLLRSTVIAEHWCWAQDEKLKKAKQEKMKKKKREEEQERNR